MEIFPIFSVTELYDERATSVARPEATVGRKIRFKSSVIYGEKLEADLPNVKTRLQSLAKYRELRGEKVAIDLIG